MVSLSDVHREKLTTSILLAMIVFVAPLGAVAQEEPDDSEGAGLVDRAAAVREMTRPAVPALEADRDLSDIEIDGVIDEADWQDAKVFTGFIQREPVEGAPVEYDTEVRVMFGDDAVWVAARMWDDHPEDIERRLSRRDQFDQGSDQFSVHFDPNLDGLTGYNFGVSAAGVQRDQYLFNDDDRDNAWDAVWSSAVNIDDQGWTVEMRIPLSQIRYEASDDPQTWGVSFYRTRTATNERSSWPLISRLRRGTVSQMGRLENVHLRESARRLEALPYVVSSLHRGPSDPGDPFFDGSSAQGRVGLDLSYGLGAAFTLDATINPDFGQVEADPAVINLSAFETFFPEQRPFFVEDARVFDFSLSGGRNQLFYSRRVGRSPHGRAPSNAEFSTIPENATIQGAAKLSGRTSNGFSVGALVAMTGNEHGKALYDDASTGEFLVEPRSEYGTVSVARDFRDGQSQIGVLGTAMRRGLPGTGQFDWLPSSAFSGGVRFNHQWNDRDWAIFGYVAGSYVQGSKEAITRIQRSSIHYYQRPDATRFTPDTTATSISGRDWRFTFAKQNGEHWTGSIWAAEVSKGFEVNDLGFSTRSEVIDGGAEISYREIQPGRYLRSYSGSLRMFHNWSHEALDDPFSIGSWNDARTGGSYNASGEVEFLNYLRVRSQVQYRPEQMSRRQTRGGPMMVSPAGGSINLNFNTDRRARIGFGGGLGFSDDFEGQGKSFFFGGGIGIRPSDNLSIQLQPNIRISRSGDQYVRATSTLPYAPTYGTRYIFADLDQREFSLETRVDWTFSPTLTLQLFAQPLVSSGNYTTYKQLAASETYDFIDLDATPVDGTQEIDFDNDGNVDYSFTDQDFNFRSLIGNAVLRWEYRPGSTIFLVWQRAQAGRASVGDFDFGRDFGALFNAPADDRFIVKVNYWLGL
ncbi:MAG: DUF5916 domain-containing protein [Gemmatimonadota bacterium]|jgi:hypothetical protein